MTVTARQVAQLLGTVLLGDDIIVAAPAPLNRASDGTVVFASAFSEDAVNTLNRAGRVLAIVSPDFEGHLACPHIVSPRPRLAFAKVLAAFFSSKLVKGVAPTARIGTKVSLGDGVSLGEYAVIGDGATIGKGSEIRHHVVIGRGTVIGNECLVKSHAVIGEEGFGFEYDEWKVPMRIPHLGSVRIGNNVEIGAGTVIARGTMDDTIIEDNVKIDDHVFIAHNVLVRNNTLIIACAELSGSVKVGANVWVGPNCTIIQKVRIGDGAMVGIGAVVTKDVAADAVVAGNPARVVGPRNT